MPRPQAAGYGFVIGVLLCFGIRHCAAVPDEDSKPSTLKLPVFDGTKKNYSMWMLKFMAYATFYKFNVLIKEMQSLGLDIRVGTGERTDAEILNESLAS